MYFYFIHQVPVSLAVPFLLTQPTPPPKPCYFLSFLCPRETKLFLNWVPETSIFPLFWSCPMETAWTTFSSKLVSLIRIKKTYWKLVLLRQQQQTKDPIIRWVQSSGSRIRKSWDHILVPLPPLWPWKGHFIFLSIMSLFVTLGTNLKAFRIQKRYLCSFPCNVCKMEALWFID